jgi:hypothetical protein
VVKKSKKSLAEHQKQKALDKLLKSSSSSTKSSSSSSSSSSDESKEMDEKDEKGITIDEITHALQTNDIVAIERPTQGCKFTNDYQLASAVILNTRSEMEDLQHVLRRSQMELSQALIDQRVADNKLKLHDEAANRSSSLASSSLIFNDALTLYTTIVPIIANILNLTSMPMSQTNDDMIWQSLGFPTSLSAMCFIARTLAES